MTPENELEVDPEKIKIKMSWHTLIGMVAIVALAVLGYADIKFTLRDLEKSLSSEREDREKGNLAIVSAMQSAFLLRDSKFSDMQRETDKNYDSIEAVRNRLGWKEKGNNR